MTDPIRNATLIGKMDAEQLTRADFLKLIGATAAGVAFLPGAEELLGEITGGGVEEAQAAAYPTISVATGHSLNGSHVAAITRTAVRNLGGMGRFVHRGDHVVVKPNIYGPRRPELAATTNPTVVATVVRMALQAGAKRVLVMDNPCGGDHASSYRVSGIADAASKAGGTVVFMSDSRYRSYAIPRGKKLKSLSLYPDIVEADVLIDVPIAKVHGGAQFTVACKNLMGVTGDPGQMHSLGLGQTIADLLSRVRPHLTVVDAIRILVMNGPGGGSVGDTRTRYTVIASKDPVAADAWTIKNAFGVDPDDVAYLWNARLMGLGRTDLRNLSVKRVKL
jgi:uncharacterized protein (DUF362 family)